MSCNYGMASNVERRKSDSPEKPEPMIREDSHEAIIDKRTL